MKIGLLTLVLSLVIVSFRVHAEIISQKGQVQVEVEIPKDLAESDFRTNDLRMDVNFNAEARYDSAVAVVLKSGVDPKDSAINPGKYTGKELYQTVGDVGWHFRPGMDLRVPSSTFELAFNGVADFVLYKGFENARTQNFSHVEGRGDLRVVLNRDELVGFEIWDHVERSERLAGRPETAMVINALSLINDAQLKAIFRISALSVEPSYHLITESYSGMGTSVLNLCQLGVDEPTCNSQYLRTLNSLTHVVGLDGRLFFYPKTALTFDSAFSVRRYTETESTEISTMRAAIGLAGLITKKMSTTLRFGWAKDVSLGSFSSPVGQAEMSYCFSERTQVRGGFLRSFGHSTPPFVSYGDNRVYLGGRVQVTEKIGIHGSGRVDWNFFIEGKDDLKPRADTILAMEFGSDFQAFPWVKLGVGYLLTRRRSNDDVVAVNLATFVRHEGYLRVHLNLP